MDDYEILNTANVVRVMICRGKGNLHGLFPHAGEYSSQWKES